MNFIEMLKSLFVKKPNTLQNKQEQQIKEIELPAKPEPEVMEFPSIRSGISLFDIDENIKTIKDLIQIYRNMSLHPEIEPALDEICDSSIVQEENKVLNIDFTDKIQDNIKTKILNEWETVKSKIDFEKNVYEWFRNWYIDGRLYFQILFNPNNLKEGIIGIKKLDPLLLQKIKDKETGNVFFIYKYKDKVFSIPEENIIFIHSNLLDYSKNVYISNLHKVIKPLNQLDLLENSAIIYRFTRAPERRVFYIDVGKMPPTKAENYIATLMRKFQNKIIYDPTTGNIHTNKNTMNMVEDFWIPRMEGRNTEITTLPPGQNINEIEDILYFRKKLLKSLKVPMNRLDSDNNPTISFDRMGEISREEIKFNKFIMRLRNHFISGVLQLLKNHLVMKNIISFDDWDNLIKPSLNIQWIEDSYFTEVKNQELFKNKLDLLQTVDGYVGKYFSKEYLFKKILKFSDDEIKEILQQIKDEGDTNPDEEQ